MPTTLLVLLAADTEANTALGFAEAAPATRANRVRAAMALRVATATDNAMRQAITALCAEAVLASQRARSLAKR